MVTYLQMVWVAEAGEQHEASHVIGVFATEESATRAALATRRYFPGGWTRPAAELYWTNGCDFVAVYAITVQD